MRDQDTPHQAGLEAEITARYSSGETRITTRRPTGLRVGDVLKVNGARSIVTAIAGEREAIVINDRRNRAARRRAAAAARKL